MSTGPGNSSLTETLSSNRALLIVGGVAIAAMLAACGLGSFLLGSFFDRDGGQAEVVDGGGDTSQESASVPTPFPQATTGATTGGEQPAIVGVSDSGTFSVTLDAPATLNLLGQALNVLPQNIGADGLWSPEIEEEDAAAWVQGAIVNYVFGLPDNDETRSLLESMQPGDAISLTTRQGVTHTFTFDNRAFVPPDDRDVFNQQTPGITLVLVGGGGDNRLVVRGRYEVGTVDSAGGNSNVVQLGETAQLGEVQITPISTSYLADRPEAPPGFAFYLIEFTMQNVGLTAVDTAGYRFTLADELGNQYALSPVASRLGNAPPLGGFINAGQTVTASAGYQIPTGLVSPTLTWTVSDQRNGTQIQAILPFTAGGQTGESATVNITTAEVTGDLNNLVVSGQITNQSSQPLVVVREDVSLRTTLGTDFLLLSSNPAFPWTIPPNQTLQFIVTFQRPFVDDSAVFTVLNQSFALSGLQPR